MEVVAVVWPRNRTEMEALPIMAANVIILFQVDSSGGTKVFFIFFSHRNTRDSSRESAHNRWFPSAGVHEEGAVEVRM